MISQYHKEREEEKEKEKAQEERGLSEMIKQEASLRKVTPQTINWTHVELTLL